jgi:1,5-anhydro-D-fructose reductase (1,5-anhydro-D-mannitol-forming)
MSAHLQGYRILMEKGVDVRIRALVARKKEDALRFRKRGEGPPPRIPIGPPGDALIAPHVWVNDFQNDVDVDVYTDYKEMLRKGDVDAVDIYTPHHTHHSMVLDSLASGKHVLVEKPLSITVKSGRMMIDAAKKAGKVLGVAECQRYEPETRTVKWIIDQGYVGEIQLIFNATIGCYWSPDKIAASTPWRHLKLMGGGGPSLDWGVHIFDAARYFGGEIEEVEGVTKIFENVRFNRDQSGRITDKVHDEVDDTFAAITKFKNGAIGQFTFSWALHGEPANLGTMIYGTKGSIKDNILTLDDGTRTPIKDIFEEKASNEKKEKLFPLQITDSFALETLDFLNAIWEDKEMETSGEEGLRDLAVSYAVIEASRLRRTVKVDDVESGELAGYEDEINAHYGI